MQQGGTGTAYLPKPAIVPVSTTKANPPRGGDAKPRVSPSRKRQPGCRKEVNSSWHLPLDAFVSKLKADGSALLYSTFLGGGGSEDIAR
jgi:hypothetical protein